MNACGNCWWADFDPEHPARHRIVEEPDYLSVSKPGAEPPMMRVVKTCFKERKYFVGHGAKGLHDCDKFEDTKDRSKRAEADDQKKRALWDAPTSRAVLPTTQNVLLLIEKIFEGCNPAYDIIIDAMMVLSEDGVSKFLVDMDDMNIRGEQIAVAYSWADKDVTRLVEGIENRSKSLVQYVNTHYEKSDEERAVVSGAHRYGHSRAKAKLTKLAGKR